MTAKSTTVWLFDYGFRVFFAGAGLFALLAMAGWGSWLGIHTAGGVFLASTIAIDPYAWHAHEMIFGYGSAVVAGFLLTAVPNWTGRPRLQGLPLAGLAGLWLSARLAMALSALVPSVVPALFELGYFAGLIGWVAIAIVKTGNRRNLPIVLMLSLLAAAAATAHLDFTGVLPGAARPAWMAALMLLVTMVLIIGGRIVPSFAGNWLRQQSREPLPRLRPRLDRAGTLAAAATVPLVVAQELSWLAPEIAGAAALTAGLLNLARLAGWWHNALLRAPILWVLFLGYGLTAAGFLAASASLAFDLLPFSTALHVWTVGGIGVMTVGVMTRVALGHTGRPLKVAGAIAVAYALLALAMLVRVLGPVFLPALYGEVLLAAAGLWCAAFAAFLIVYLPILAGPPAPRC